MPLPPVDPRACCHPCRARVDDGIGAEEDDEEPPPPPDEAEGRIARLYATRAQIRVMMRNGVAAVEGGRPNCPLCDFPMNPDGHICPRWN